MDTQFMDIETAYMHIKKFVLCYSTNARIFFFPEQLKCFLLFIQEKMRGNTRIVERIQKYLNSGSYCLSTPDVLEFLDYYESKQSLPVNLNSELIEAINNCFK